MGKTIALMPLRGGTTSIPGKNIKAFKGLSGHKKDLYRWNMDVLIESKHFDEVWVSTDSYTIEENIREYYGTRVLVFRRSERTARDTAITREVLQEFIEGASLEDDDLLVYSQATSPYLRDKDITTGLTFLKTAAPDVETPPRKYRSFLTVGVLKRFIWSDWGTVINTPNGERRRRQDWSGSYIENGCLYGLYAGDLRRNATRATPPVAYVKQPWWFELDEPDDWALGELILAQVKQNEKEGL